MTPLFQCRGVGSTPGQRAKIPKAMGAQLKKKKKKIEFEYSNNNGVYFFQLHVKLDVWSKLTILITQKVLEPRPLGALKGIGGKMTV